MYPLNNWHNLKRGYRFKDRTWYSKYHLGLDLIAPKGTPIFAPFDGRVRVMTGFEGGKTIWFYWDDKIIRVLHLSKFGKRGRVEKGDIIGYVGNTGSLSRGDHAHIDISKNKIDIYDINNFVDPETFNWNNKTTMFIKKVRDGKIYALIGNKLIHWNTVWQLFNENFENATVIELNKKEFAKFEIVKNVSIKNEFKNTETDQAIPRNHKENMEKDIFSYKK